ncbi:MAG: methyltransferase domain-containing protein [Gammaproteobacteria bacterium]|nr:methyltransferase domain-containing protein [Gammaproteobacteria bacterium]
MHQSSLANMEQFCQRYLDGFRADPLTIYDIGSSDVNGSYRPLFSAPQWRYIGVDMAAGENVDMVLDDIYRWQQIPDGGADVVISGQAFEHIEYIWITMLEIFRILKPGGLCCIIAPSGGYEHRYPLDCWRFYGDGFRALARYASLDVVEATTENDHGSYSDDSLLWRDTMLVARKPHFNPLTRLKAAVKHRLLRELSL